MSGCRRSSSRRGRWKHRVRCFRAYGTGNEVSIEQVYMDAQGVDMERERRDDIDVDVHIDIVEGEGVALGADEHTNLRC